MKKVILSLIMCASVLANASAEVVTTQIGVKPNTATVTTDSESKTMTISGTGDLTQIINTNVPYYFTSAAVGTVFTASDGSAAEGVAENSQLNKTYYVLSQYKKTTDPDNESVTGFGVKTYYVKNGESYSCAYGSVYSEDKTYATVTATTLDFSSSTTTDYQTYLQAIRKFTSSASCYDKVGDSYIKVSAGEICDPTKDYWWFNGSGYYSNPGSTIIGWNDGNTVSSVSFKTIEGVYVQTNGIYTQITTADYDASTSYYTVVYTDLSDAEETEMAGNTGNFLTVKVVKNINSVIYYFDGSNYTLVSNGDTYHEDSYYVKEDSYAEKTYEELYNLGYATKTDTPFWDYIVNTANTEGYTDLIVNSATSTMATIDNTVTQKLMTLTGTYVLDLSGVGIQQITAPYTDYSFQTTNTNATFANSTNFYTNNDCIETLYTPVVLGTTDAETTLSYGTFSKFTGLRYLHISDGIETLGEKSISAGTFKLSSITFPNTLKYIKKNSVNGHYDASSPHTTLKDHNGNYIEYIQTLTFPESLLEIESNAFFDGMTGTCPKDVYFLGVEAPKVGRHAWGDNAYISNNAFSTSAETGTGEEKVTISVADGVASRDNYKAGSGWECMLHYPSSCTPAQAAKYTDPSRDYRKIIYNKYGWKTGDGTVISPDDPQMSFNGAYTYYTPGKETTNLTGFGSSTTNAALKAFGNEYSDGSYGGDYSGGYYDFYLDDQYLWPSMTMMYRATVVAQNNLTWDGVTTIGQMIRSKIASGDNYEYTGDGSEYIGLHQFVFAKGDVTFTDAEKFDLTKYGDSKWHTICLPFNMTKKQMKDGFGATGKDAEGKLIYDIRLCEFDGVTRNKENIQLRFNTNVFKNATDNEVVLEAHHAYMIKACKANVVTVEFKNYEIVAGDPVPTKQMSDCTDDTHQESLEYRFIGNYLTYKVGRSHLSNTDDDEENMIRMPQYSYYFSSSYQGYKFRLDAQNGIWSPYTCIIEAPDGAGDYSAYFKNSGAKLSTVFEGDQEDIQTEIKNVTIECDHEIVYDSNAVYDITGRKIADSKTNLPKGMYISNGKKFVVK